MWTFATHPERPNPAGRRPGWLLASFLCLVTGLVRAGDAGSGDDTTTPQPAAEQIIISHGYSPFGELKYPADFHHFDYVNPDAPKGGTLRLFGFGSFDSLNPYVISGTSPAGTPGASVFGFLETTDTLLMGSGSHNRVGDEPGSAYGLIAKTVEYPASLDWVIFRLRPEARFSDGTPITAEDAVFSFNLLREQGHPRYQLMLRDVESAEMLDAHSVRYHLTGDSRRDLPLVIGDLPVLPAHYWRERAFAGTLEPPVISSPYRISRVRPGRQIVFERVDNYWARDLPVNRGRYNFDRVVIDYYRDAQVGFEAFKSGGYDLHLDYVAKHWATAYDVPAVRDGRILRAEIPHRIPKPTQAFFINQRRAPLDDRRVREALNLLFDFEWTNQTIFNGAYVRSESWFPNSLNHAEGLPTERELALLEPWREQLPPALFTQPFRHPVSDGSGNIRARMRQALALLDEAGWAPRGRYLRHKDTDAPLKLEILNYQTPGMTRVVEPWLRNLERIGIQASYRAVDLATYKERLDRFDYDITIFVLPQRAYPGAELVDYLHSRSADVPGSRNYSRVSDPVVDALVDASMNASTEADYHAAIKALDRVLLWQHYSVPHWYIDHHRLAWWDKFGRPDAPMPYILGTETWWAKGKP
ncbi:oligopeptide ABC transporter periplasmic peptide-binding protein [Isoalcanivorax pacificus W11-5]|uniref:Oligopeptide ABC transporter periplasmic peptide-binding protein n=1 Tax=Isoalcanivorax pacificus W11-5 TaxID=391936 RepID=A0A0B4XJB9_9GAMM|nr:extracellular solute-binding protein [Isoalcanivorax pacificus]AJD48379.1 oligopeptide ABC transporter periplasmic peptide-binding protein [Isoalcanivorax pacificus W11-5]